MYFFAVRLTSSSYHTLYFGVPFLANINQYTYRNEKTKATTITVEYGLEHVYNHISLRIFPVLHFMIYVHVCEMVAFTSNKSNQNL